MCIGGSILNVPLAKIRELQRVPYSSLRLKWKLSEWSWVPARLMWAIFCSALTRQRNDVDGAHCFPCPRPGTSRLGQRHGVIVQRQLAISLEQRSLHADRADVGHWPAVMMPSFGFRSVFPPLPTIRSTPFGFTAGVWNRAGRLGHTRHSFGSDRLRLTSWLAPVDVVYRGCIMLLRCIRLV